MLFSFIEESHFGVKDYDEFTHYGDDGDFRRFSGCSQSFVEILYFWIAPQSTDGRHIQSRSRSLPAASYLALPGL
jgi:hypothetical protein